MPALTCWYWGISRYRAKASFQSASLSGGTAPMIGFHSVIDRPEPVRRVIPPTTTMANTRTATQNSQIATGRERSHAEKRFIRRPSFTKGATDRVRETRRFPYAYRMA